MGVAIRNRLERPAAGNRVAESILLHALPAAMVVWNRESALG